ncbi:hypothetical protein AaE_013926 [Aphanomyces astaci]|uniref:Uncharacterized protein n=1 Tax=Aphanomyces astaci TaxID=112090 RepID=A0A6A4Z8W0_APHAT|nr:hypothetical protein AaE_013926 [Aphanomyces astaci]
MHLELPSSRWWRSLGLVPRHTKSDKPPEKSKTSFFKWRRQSTVGVADDDESTPPPPPAITNNVVAPPATDVEEVEPPTKRMQVPVTIPLEYLYKRETFVGGKKVPYTRLHAKQRRMRLIIYDRIHEDKPILVF